MFDVSKIIVHNTCFSSRIFDCFFAGKNIKARDIQLVMTRLRS